MEHAVVYSYITRPKLPPELTDAIIHELRFNQPALLNCSLICRIWIPASRIHLFRIFPKPSFRDFVDNLNSPDSTISGYVRHIILLRTILHMSFFRTWTISRTWSLSRSDTSTGNLWSHPPISLRFQRFHDWKSWFWRTFSWRTNARSEISQAGYRHWSVCVSISCIQIIITLFAMHAWINISHLYGSLILFRFGVISRVGSHLHTLSILLSSVIVITVSMTWQCTVGTYYLLAPHSNI